MKWMRIAAAVLLAAFMVINPSGNALAAKDGKEEEKPYYGWYSDLKTGKRYFYDRNGELHYGWLRYQGAWYYFTTLGNMVDGGYRSIDGEQYFFYNTGRMASCKYIGLNYMDENGRHDERHDVRLVGNGDVTTYDRDMISDSVYFVPDKWVKKFIDDGWELMFYTKKSYFEAPDTDLGVYYLRHKLDTTYKKLKFIDPNEVARGFGEFIGYALGLYEEENETMAALWGDQSAIEDMEEIPDYYEDDPAFYFGILCQLYWDPGTTDELYEAAPDTWELLKTLLQ